MKKMLLSSVVAMAMFLPLHAFASDGTTSLNGGTTPDSFFYPLDKMIESIQLALTTNGVQKAALLNEISNERLAEAKTMLDENKDKLSTDTLKAYQDTLTSLDKQINTDINQGEDVSGVVQSMDTTQKAVDSTLKNMDSQMASDGEQNLLSSIENTQSDIQDTADAVKLVDGTDSTTGDSSTSTDTQTTTPLKAQATNSVLASTIGSDNLQQAQTNGLNTRQIMAIQALADQSGKTFQDVLALFKANGEGIGATAKALGLKPSEALKAVNKGFKTVMKASQSEFKQLQATQGTTGTANDNQTASSNDQTQSGDSATSNNATSTTNGKGTSKASSHAIQAQGQAKATANRSVAKQKADFGKSHATEHHSVPTQATVNQSTAKAKAETGKAQGNEHHTTQAPKKSQSVTPTNKTDTKKEVKRTTQSVQSVEQTSTVVPDQPSSQPSVTHGSSSNEHSQSSDHGKSGH